MDDTERFHSRIIDNAAVWINTLDHAGRITLWNKAAEAISGYTRDEVLGGTEIWEWLYPDTTYREEIFARAAAVLEQGDGVADFETTIRTRAGEYRTLSWYSQQFFGADGEVLGSSAIAQDVTERRKVEESHRRQYRLQEMIAEISAELINLVSDEVDRVVQRALQRLGTFFESGRAYVFRFDRDYRVMDNVNEWCAEGVESHRQRLQGIPLEAHPWVTSRIREGRVIHVPDIEALPVEAAVEQDEFRNQDIRSLLLIPLISDQQVFGFVGYDSVGRPRTWTDEQITTLRVAADILAGTFARKQAEMELSRQARVDGLTGLANRREFDSALERECAARRKRSLALLMIDIDHFKPFNDTYGHQRGDDCLRQVAKVLRDATQRPADTVARYGGEEFTCILPDTTLEGAEVVAERIRGRIEAMKIAHADSDLGVVTVSIGVCAVHTGWPLEPPVLLQRADDLLYQAKRAGRNRVCAGPVQPGRP